MSWKHLSLETLRTFKIDHSVDEVIFNADYVFSKLRVYRQIQTMF